MVKRAIGLVAIAVAAAGGGLLAGALAGDDPDTATIPGTPGRAAEIGDRAARQPAEQRRGGGYRDDADDRPLSAAEADRAVAAALRIAGGGTVTDVDRSDDPGEAYEVEVFSDGREIDVALDAEFRRVPNRRYED